MNLAENLLSSKPFVCPNCGQELPLADVNVARDVALCRACNYTGSFLAASTVPRLTDEELARPPKRVSLKREFGDALTVVCRPRRGTLWFLVPFTAFWSGISMAGIYGSQIVRGAFDPKLSLFGLPFLAGTVVLVTIILYCLFGRTAVTLSKGRIRVFTGLFGVGRTRELECGPGTTVTIGQSGYRVNNVTQPEIVVASGERQLKFGAMAIPNDALPYVAAVLRRAAGGG
ncbi:MAG TPA: hypothetical protein P5204_02345 [Kiritimatiellia bacterium]|nr:hypothetical protein [Kiritimatiellia bacterium]